MKPAAPQIWVMTDTQSPLPDTIVLDAGQPELNAFDFSRQMLLFAFMGFQGVTGPKITILRMRQDGDTIYVVSSLDPDGPSYQPSWSSPARVAKVSKAGMAQFGELTFRLLDQTGAERAVTSANVSAPP